MSKYLTAYFNTKNILSVMIACTLLLTLSACGSTSGVANTDPSAEAPASTAEQTQQSSAKVLVVVFSATGTTKGVAERIAAMESADLYEIVPAVPYSEDDLNWRDSSSRATKEQSDRFVRPCIASEALELAGYEKIYLGYPIWWGEEPRIMDTFVESYDFSCITMIPFCTSSSSDIGGSRQSLAELAGSGNWMEGGRFPGSTSDSDLQSWLENLR